MRCDNKSNKSYKNYGGRGITYSEDWKDFEKFYSDMGHTYKKGLTIERINNDGDYSKDNCIWADMRTQANNTRKNRNITIGNKTLTLSEWCRIYDTDYSMVRRRLNRGWDALEALTKPSTKK